jgi:hypothetical protein
MVVMHALREGTFSYQFTISHGMVYAKHAHSLQFSYGVGFWMNGFRVNNVHIIICHNILMELVLLPVRVLFDLCR